MKRSISLWQFVGFALVSLLGTILHFLYDFTGENLLVAPFSGVNESTFEHMKLLFWPMLIFAIAERFLFKEQEGFFCIKLCGVLTGLLLIPTLFYTYNGVFGKSPDYVNISIFFISAAIAFTVEARLFKSEKTVCSSSALAFFILLLIALFFVLFTFYPPMLPLFEDPISGGYGIL